MGKYQHIPANHVPLVAIHALDRLPLNAQAANMILLLLANIILFMEVLPVALIA